MPGQAINAGAILICPMGIVPISVFMALPTSFVIIAGTIAGKITDCAPFVNANVFGTCGVFLYLLPCIPALSPWIPTSTVLVGAMPALTSTSMAFCMTGLGIPVKVVSTQVQVLV
ncbi:MAG: DUF4280 domain-containing protein [Silvanigrellaceae bacterium]|nr:DUF4280 domain-containing protein [Silvanigrellaceae bacterium]